MVETHPFRIWRKDTGTTLETVAARVGCQASFLSDMERGQKTPGLSLALKLSAMSGIPVERFAKAEAAA